MRLFGPVEIGVEHHTMRVIHRAEDAVAPLPRLLPPPGITLERAAPQIVVADLEFDPQCRHVTPEGKLRLAARQSRTVKTRSGQLLEVIRNAASADPEIGTLWEEIQAKLHQVARALIEQLHSSNALRPDLAPATAADILFTLNHPAVWQLLVRECQWEPGQYQQWLEQTLRSQLLRNAEPAPAIPERPRNPNP